MRILFVDDAVDTRELFRLSFQLEGHRTYLANNGGEAVAAVRAAAEDDQLDAIVMDIEMPGMTGWDAAREIRKLEAGQTVPLILFSAYHDTPEDHQQAALAGADALLHKPILPQDLLTHLSQLTKS